MMVLDGLDEEVAGFLEEGVYTEIKGVEVRIERSRGNLWVQFQGREVWWKLQLGL